MDTIDFESLTVLEIMVLRTLRNRAEDFPDDERPPLPSMAEIDAALDGTGYGLAKSLGHQWDAVGEWVYDNFPQFNIDAHEED